MTPESPFHAGEQAVQSALGVRDAIEPWANQVIRPYFPEQHRDFHTAMPFLVAAARDGAGNPWVTLLAGDEGFVTSPDDRRLVIEATPGQDDPLGDALGEGADLGLLGIELATRRRNRANGRVGKRSGERLEFLLDQSFGNCPQYIREREWRRVVPAPQPAERHDALTAAMVDWIQAADTVFIGSGYRGEGEHPGYGMDASHRGGEPGFVAVESRTRLVMPDYAGNRHYNTIGNLMMDARAALTFVDFEAGSLLQLTGRTRVHTDADALARHPGAHRLVVFDVDQAVVQAGVLPLRWTDLGGAVRSLRVTGRVEESPDVVSIVLEARDDGPLPSFEAGQHLPLVLPRASGGSVARTYSLSGDPARDDYRITVKRHDRGEVSRLIHDHLQPGHIVDARAPAGDFVIAGGDRPVVLLSAGVGITPMVSMLHALADSDRPVHFLHGARGAVPLLDEVVQRVESRPGTTLRVTMSGPGAVADQPWKSLGRLDARTVLETVGTMDAEFHLCGPGGFMAAMQAGLVEQGVDPARLHAESFGPSALAGGESPAAA